MRYTTVVDSVGIRVECTSAYEQRELLDNLIAYAKNSNSSYFVNYKDYIINPLTGSFNREYFIYSHGKTLASITTMSYQVGKHRKQTVYYIKIVWAGLKSYNDFIDRLSLYCMMNITSWLGSYSYKLTLCELDIAIDVECEFMNVLALCVKRVPNVKYYNPDETQMYDGETAWIEKINLQRKRHVKSRAQVYTKDLKEELEDINITRFELALPTPFFNDKGNNFYEILLSVFTTLDRYAVMYFEDINQKNNIAQQYTEIVTSKLINKSRKLKGLELDSYRLYPDIQYIEQFLDAVFFTNDFHTIDDNDLIKDSILSELINAPLVFD